MKQVLVCPRCYSENVYASGDFLFCETCRAQSTVLHALKNNNCPVPDIMAKIVVMDKAEIMSLLQDSSPSLYEKCYIMERGQILFVIEEYLSRNPRYANSVRRHLNLPLQVRVVTKKGREAIKLDYQTFIGTLMDGPTGQHNILQFSDMEKKWRSHLQLRDNGRYYIEYKSLLSVMLERADSMSAEELYEMWPRIGVAISNGIRAYVNP